MAQQLSLDGYASGPPTPDVRFVRSPDGGWRFADPDGKLLLHPDPEPEDPLPRTGISDRVRAVLQNPDTWVQ